MSVPANEHFFDLLWSHSFVSPLEQWHQVQQLPLEQEQKWTLIQCPQQRCVLLLHHRCVVE